METKTWDVPGSCTKQEALDLMDLHGAVGVVQMVGADGPQFDCEVTFLGFRGKWGPEDNYAKSHGFYKFGPVDDPDDKHKRFTTLPGSGVPVLEVVMEESEVDDGVHCDDH